MSSMDRWSLLFILLNFCLSSLAFAKIAEVRVLGEVEESFELKNVCEEMGLKENLMVDIVNAHEIDCMGRKLRVADFCQKKFPKLKDQTKTFLTKSYVGLATKRVYCQRADSVLLRLECDGEHRSYCEVPKAGCERLRSVFAAQLPLIESTKIGTILKCYYSADENPQVIER